MLPSGEGFWIALARSVLWILFAAATLLIAFFTFTLVANLIGAPFNGLLAEKAETLLTGRKSPIASGGLKAALREIGPTLRNELLKLLYFVAWSIGLLLVTFVPVVNLLSPFLWFLFGAWMLALEYLGYPMENHGLRFKNVRQQIASRRMLSMSFGAAALGATMIPVVNFLVMPAAVAGATALWVDHWHESQAAAGPIQPAASKPS
jgi:CysZ protein